MAGIELAYIDRVAVATIDRPEKRNAFDADMWSALEKVVSDLKKKLPRVIVITGAGDKAFCAGFDVSLENPQMANIVSFIESKDRGPVEELIGYVRKSVDALVSLPVPIIAAVNGLAYGGGAELAMRCDLRVMDPEAVICFSEVKLGLMPDWGGGVALSRLIGRSRAADLILTARKVGSREASELGLTNRISEPGKSLEKALQIAQTIAKNGPKAVQHALKILRESHDLSYKDALEMETATAISLILQGECLHGISAFLSGKEVEFLD